MNENMNEEEIHLRDYLRVVRKRKNTVLTFFFVTLVIVFIGTFTRTPLYEASTKILIEKNETNPLMTNYGYSLGDPVFLETQFQIIKSTAVAQKVVKILSLDTRYVSYFIKDAEDLSFISATMNWFRRVISVMGKITGMASPSSHGDASLTDNEEKSTADIIAERISANITVQPVRNSRIVDVGYTSENPMLAKMIVNTVAKAYIEEILEMKMNSSGYAIKWMTQKAEEERGKLEDSENALQEYMKAKDIITTENKIAIIPQKLSELSSKLTRAETKRNELEALYRKVNNVSISEAETVPVIASSRTLQAIRGQILKADQHIMEISKKYGKKHPVMIRAVGDLEILKKKRRQEIQWLIKSIKDDYELANSNEENINKQLEDTKFEAVSLNEKFIQYNILKRDVESNRNIYDALIKRIKEQGITEETQTVNIWIVEKADRPEFPSKPNKKRNILLGIIMGLFGGIGLAFFIEYLDQTVKSPDEAEERLGVPVLGMVPLLKSKEEIPEKAVLKSPGSAFAESYKNIRTSLLLSSAEGVPKNMLVTSVTMEEGKSTTAVNIALAFAQSDYRVLLVDGDLRKPRIHKIFGLDNTKGFSTWLAGMTDMEIVRNGPVDNLSLVTSGPVPPNPSELLSSARVNEFIKVLNEKYDFIIFDSPPMMSVTDSLLLSKALESTIFVIRAGKTTYETVARSLKSLSDINSNMLGVVLNAADVKKSNYYYYYGYKNYYSDND